MEWGGRWKPLQYAVKRSYAPVVVTFSGRLSSSITTTELWAVNDELTDSVVNYQVYMLPWGENVGLDTKRIIANGKSTVTKGSSALLGTIDYNQDILASQGCTIETCFLYCVSSASLNGVTRSLPNTYFAMTTMKNTQFGPSSKALVSSIKQLSETKIQFQVAVNTTSPFLFMELKDSDISTSGVGVNNANAGWFSDNNFLALANQMYEITYTSYNSIGSIDTFLSRLQIRTLLDVKSTC
jgi:hypothetical protein